MTNFWSGGMRENEKKCHRGAFSAVYGSAFEQLFPWVRNPEQQLQLEKIVTFNQGFWVGDEMRDKGKGGGSGERRGGWRWRQGTSCTAMTSFSCSGIYTGNGQSIFQSSLTLKASWRQEKAQRERSFCISLSGPACQKAERWWQDWTSSWFAWCFWLSAPGVSAQVSPTTSPNSLKWFLSQFAAAQVNESRSSSVLSLTAFRWQKLWLLCFSPVLTVRTEMFISILRVCKAVNVVSRKCNIFILLWNITTREKIDQSNMTKLKICSGLVVIEKNRSCVCQPADVKTPHSQSIVSFFSFY